MGPGLFILLIGFLTFLWLCKLFIHDDSFRKKESFENEEITDDNIDELIDFVKEEMAKGSLNEKADGNGWESYLAFKKGKNYYLERIDRDDDELEENLMARVDEDNGRKSYKIFKGPHPINTKAEEKERSPYLVGEHHGLNSQIRIHHDRNRVDIGLKNQQIQIRGIGTMYRRDGLPHPWYYGAPIIFTKGGRPVGLMEYEDDPRKFDEQSDHLPVILSIPKKEEQDLPLYLQVYALLQEHISKKKI